MHFLMQGVLRQSARQSQLIESLTKLAAAKDIGAYAALEAGQQSLGSVEMPYVPLDDESVALMLAQRYSDRGIDPNFALSPDSDPLEDFGGPEAFK
jgi:hypothetical protein